MRLRFPELLEEHNVTAWKLAKLAGIPEATMYRFKRNRGRVSLVSSHIIEAIAKALGITDMNKIIELEGTARRVQRKHGKSGARHT